jgi:SHAQKYF class myb-like DNA-binding protein
MSVRSVSKKEGRWTAEEHFRFIEALILYGKEWRQVQEHVRTRSSTQARSHAQKFFVKLQRRNEELTDYLKNYDLELMRQRMTNPDADYEDSDSLN